MGDKPMAHEHSHDHASDLTEQLCTLGIAGAIGLVTVLMYTQNKLRWVLVEKLHIYVFLSGVALLALVALRAMLLFASSTRRSPAEAEHEHGPGCDHNHDHVHDHGHDHHHDHDHDHDHNHVHDHDKEVAEHTHSHDQEQDEDDCCDHGHSHSWNPARYVFLLLPVVLFLLNLPNSGLSVRAQAIDTNSLEAVKGSTGRSGKTVTPIGFKELQGASFHDYTRDFWNGQLVRLKGQFKPSGNARAFSLVRVKITCCAADAIPLNVVIMLDPAAQGSFDKFRDQQWVDVTGEVQFLKKKDKDEYVTVLLVGSTGDVQPTDPDPNPYVQ
jgi:hypothetical protein